jgi:hypothetical protein
LLLRCDFNCECNFGCSDAILSCYDAISVAAMRFQQLHCDFGFFNAISTIAMRFLAFAMQFSSGGVVRFQLQ